MKAIVATGYGGPATSLNFLQMLAHIQPGQKVLINGVSGSLGTAAVQLAAHLGAEVPGVCRPHNVGLMESLGALHVIDYAGKDFTRSHQMYDVVYDTIGKSSFSQCKEILSPEGMDLSPVLSFPLLLQMLRTSLWGKKKVKFRATGLKTDEEIKALFTTLIEIFRQGHLKTVIDRQYPLEKVREAHRYIDAGHKKGNVIIRVHPENL